MKFMNKKQYYAIALLVLLLDCLTKWFVRLYLDPHRSVELIPGFLRFSYWENSGVAFGLFDAVASAWKPYVLASIAAVAVVAIIIYSAHVPAERRLMQAALAVITGGILGNFIDRVARGCVIDFIDFHVYDAFRWPTFNVADSAITIGIALLLIDTIKNPVVKEDSAQEELGLKS